MMKRRSLAVDVAISIATEIAAHPPDANRFTEVMGRDNKKVPTLRGRTVINLFFEASTRTSTSFELAAKRLSADVVSIKGAGSSVEKGESLKDTILTLNAYGPDIFVIRHGGVGACHLAARFTDAAVLNAGDGKHEHPSQALLDLYTIEREVGPLDGPARRGRRGHRPLAGRPLGHRGVHDDGGQGDVRRASDAASLARGGGPGRRDLVRHPRHRRRRRRLRAADAARTDGRRRLRAEPARVRRRFGVSHERLRPGQRVMHAGPINRGVELTGALADDPATLIERQAANGLVVRMAILYDLLAEPAAVARGHRAGRRGGCVSGVQLVQRPGPAASLVITGVRMLDPAAGIDAIGDLVVRDGASAATPRVSSGSTARGCSRRPASSTRTFTCAHPVGRTPKTSPRGSRAAAAGGFVTIIAMPNTTPVVDNAAVLGVAA